MATAVTSSVSQNKENYKKMNLNMNMKKIGFLAATTLAALTATPSALGFAINMEQGQFQAGVGGEFVALENEGLVNDYASVARQTVGFPSPSSSLLRHRVFHLLPGIQ